MVNKKDVCQTLIDGKIIIVYFGNNGDYKYYSFRSRTRF